MQRESEQSDAPDVAPQPHGATMSIERVVKRAKEIAQTGSITDAVKFLDEELRRSGDHALLLREKANFHFFEDDYALAAEAFDRLIRIEPNNSDALLGKGWSLLYQGKAGDAADCARRGLQVHSRSVTGHMLLGDALLGLQRWKEAFASFETASGLSPQYFDAANWAARGDRFLEAGEQELALEAYQRAINQDPNNPEGWYGKGRLLSLQQDYDGALAALERASIQTEEAGRPVDTRAWAAKRQSGAEPQGARFIAGFLEAGELCVRLGRDNEACSYFERAANAQDQDPRPWIGLGGVHQKLGNYAQAQTAFERALSLDPSDADTWNSLGNNYHVLNQFDDAKRCYSRAIEIQPKFIWPYYNLAVTLMIQRRFKEAIAAIELGISHDPTNLDARVSRLKILNAIDSTERAVICAQAQELIDQVEDTLSLKLGVAGVLMDNGVSNPARAFVENHNPWELDGDGDRLDFAECLLELGEPVRALELLREMDSIRAPEWRTVRCYLLLLADRLAGRGPLSDALLHTFLNEFRTLATLAPARRMVWGYRGVRTLVFRTDLTVPEKFLLITLGDLQEGKLTREDLSFFSQDAVDTRTGSTTAAEG